MTKSQRARFKVSPAEISEFLQLVLRIRRLGSVGAVAAAGWLDAAGILRDSPKRRGKPLRDLLRAQMILGQHQEPTGRWYIRRSS
jgi:hypothetical protein